MTSPRLRMRSARACRMPDSGVSPPTFDSSSALHTTEKWLGADLGEARAAKQSGDTAAAHDAYQKLVALSKPVGPERPELAEAKAYLTN